MHIILIGNYPTDKQESMERFAQMMDTNFKRIGLTSEIWRPTVILGKGCKSTTKGFGKLFGYIDKWLFFPIILYVRRFKKEFFKADIHFHICDHGNAPYLMFLPADRTVVTCHDVLAIRSAMGFSGAYTSVSRFGRYYQNWILYYLNRAQRVAFVSNCTMKHFHELLPKYRSLKKECVVIHNSFNARFKQITVEETESLITKVGVKLGTSFLLHVGSGGTRKNRKLLLDLANVLGNRWAGQICFAGEEVEPELYSYAESLGLEKRLISIVKPDHRTLVSLYNFCEAFIFPSFAEGFGWPIIEAQACGSPVIVSNIEPLREVSGDGALYANPNNPYEFARAFLLLKDRACRLELIQRALENSRRFDSERMINAYLNLHGFYHAEFSRSGIRKFSI